MVERLSGDYIRGYTKALLDFREIIRYVNCDLSYHKKRWNYTLFNKLLDCCIENRENLRETQSGLSDGFIRWNQNKNDFEYFERNKHE